MRILHFADIHFGMENYGRLDPKTGLHSRLSDFEKSFQAVVDFAVGNTSRSEPPVNKEGPVDLVVFAGDAFKTRDPSPTYVRAFAKGIRDMADTGVPVVMVVGNHDAPNASGKATTLDIFSTLSVPNVTVSFKPELFTVATKAGPIQVATLPWVSKSYFFSKDDLVGKTGEEVGRLFQQKIVDSFRVLLARIDPTIPAIGVLHATVEGASFGSERSVLLGSDIVVPVKLLQSPKLAYVAAGHLHRRQRLPGTPPVAYSGSLERIDFSEEKKEKGCFLVTLDRKGTRVTEVNVPARRFLTIPIVLSGPTLDPTAQVVSTIKKQPIRDAVVRLIIEGPEELTTQIREMPIREALASAHFFAGITKHTRSGDRLVKEVGYGDELLTAGPLEVLARYWKSRTLSKARIDRLNEVAEELLKSVETG
jgi:exonuclease SbcD